MPDGNKLKGKKIAIIGAGYLQLPLVKKASEMGLLTYCFAHEDGAVCRDFCTEFFPVSVLDKDDILKICEKIGIEAVSTIASDITVPTVNYVASKLSLVGNPVDSSIICTNKYRMKRVLRDDGFKVANFYSVNAFSDLENAGSLNYPLIVKPADRSGSLGVKKIASESELEEAFKTALDCSLGKEVIVEEFIEGYELSVESISMQGRHFILALTDKVTTGAPHFVELEHHQPAEVGEELRNEILDIIPKALSSLNIQSGAAHSEIIISDGAIYINEIGARMGGDFIGSHLVELSTGYDYLKGVIEVALGINNEPVINKQKHSGVIFGSPETQDSLTKTDVTNPAFVEYKMPSKKLETLTKSGDRDGYFIYQSDKKNRV